MPPETRKGRARRFESIFFLNADETASAPYNPHIRSIGNGGKAMASFRSLLGKRTASLKKRSRKKHARRYTPSSEKGTSMNLMQAIEERHAVRSYRDKPLSHEVAAHLKEVITRCNTEGDLRFQLVRECPSAFSRFASYGMFKGVHDCVAFIGRREDGLEEKIGYYGELLALEAQRVGLNKLLGGVNVSQEASEGIYRTRRNVPLRSDDWIRRQPRKTPCYQAARRALPQRRESRA